MRLSGSREEQAQVVVDLRRGGERAANSRRARSLIDGDGGRQASHRVDVRMRKLTHKLPRLSRQRFEVPSLPFGEQRGERERAFATAAQSGDHDQPVPRNVDIDAAQVVSPRAANFDLRSVAGECQSDSSHVTISSKPSDEADQKRISSGRYFSIKDS